MNITVKLDVISAFTIFIIFIVLKFYGVINWSWFWVLSPLWILAALIILIILGILGYTLFKIISSIIYFKIQEKKEKKRQCRPLYKNE